MNLKEKINAEKTNLQTQWDQLLELAKQKKTEYENATAQYEKANQEIRDAQFELRGKYAELDAVLTMVDEAEKEEAQDVEPSSCADEEFNFDDAVDIEEAVDVKDEDEMIFE